LIASTVSLDDVAGVLSGERPIGASDGPKIHVAPPRRDADDLRRAGSRHT
jgi:hypothetical protein